MNSRKEQFSARLLEENNFPLSLVSQKCFCFIITDESANQQEESKSDEPQTMEEHLEMLDRVRRESEENRKYWKEEMKSMNKWEKYGLG